MKEKEEKLMRQLDRDQQRQQHTLDRYHEQDAARNQHASRKDPISAPGSCEVIAENQIPEQANLKRSNSFISWPSHDYIVSQQILTYYCCGIVMAYCFALRLLIGHHSKKKT